MKNLKLFLSEIKKNITAVKSMTYCVFHWGFLHIFSPERLFGAFVSSRWAKGGVVIQGARESVFVTKADHSFFTEPVSCQVFNAVGSTNVSILVDVHCKYQLRKIQSVLFNGIF